MTTDRGKIAKTYAKDDFFFHFSKHSPHNRHITSEIAILLLV
jgi:hypothetical protein